MIIFLTGFMGSGKSHWGKLWAKECKWDFVDLDALIEKEEERSIENIFEEKGEAYFRSIETKLLHSLKNKHNCIVACGGGTPCFNDNMNWMNENGTTVFLSAPTQHLVENILKDKERRPLVKNIQPAELASFTEKKLLERQKFYSAAKFQLDISALNNETIFHIIHHIS